MQYKKNPFILIITLSWVQGSYSQPIKVPFLLMAMKDFRKTALLPGRLFGNMTWRTPNGSSITSASGRGSAPGRRSQPVRGAAAKAYERRDWCFGINFRSQDSTWRRTARNAGANYCQLTARRSRGRTGGKCQATEREEGGKGLVWWVCGDRNNIVYRGEHSHRAVPWDLGEGWTERLKRLVWREQRHSRHWLQPGDVGISVSHVDM